MSVDIACECDGLPPHSHIFEHVRDDSDPFDVVLRPVDTGEVSVWVDWKAVAHALAVPDDS